MYHIPEALYEEKMPRRAKQLFVDTFSQHHKLNAGDEDAAMNKARQALEERYVRVNDLQWIPRRAAYEIVRDELSSDSEGARRVAAPPSNPVKQRFHDSAKRRFSETSNSTVSSNSSSSAHESEDPSTSADRPAARKKRVRGKVIASKKFAGQSARRLFSSDEEGY